VKALVPAPFAVFFAVVAACGILAAPSVHAGEFDIKREYQHKADRIIRTVMAGNDAQAKITELCDDIGHRISGSEALNKACRWAAETMRADGQEEVRLESVSIPKWVRGRESATMLTPRETPLAMLGLGGSVATPPGGVTAPVIVARDRDELIAKGEAVRGKIVLFNHAMPQYTPDKGTGYGQTVTYRYNGAKWAAQQGAVACLVRSVTATSLRSPHTGGMGYQDATVRIPTAAISVEDAEMIARLCERGKNVTVQLKMEAADHGEAQGSNVLGELRGSTHPDEIVVIGGHIDSWDVGQGAHDDGGGCVAAMEALNVLRKMGLRPRRTIRVVLWTAEEVGLYGAKAYAKAHADELERHVAAIESDIGSFKPAGYSMDCKDDRKREIAERQMRQILSMCESIGPLDLDVGFAAADVSPMREAGVVIMGHNSDRARYFDYHHTHADTLDKINPVELSQNVAVMATVAYTIADMPPRLGEEGR